MLDCCAATSSHSMQYCLDEGDIICQGSARGIVCLTTSLRASNPVLVRAASIAVGSEIMATISSFGARSTARGTTTLVTCIGNGGATTTSARELVCLPSRLGASDPVLVGAASIAVGS